MHTWSYMPIAEHCPSVTKTYWDGFNHDVELLSKTWSQKIKPFLIDNLCKTIKQSGMKTSTPNCYRLCLLHFFLHFIEDPRLKTTFSMPMCAWQLQYESTESYGCIYAYQTACKKSNAYFSSYLKHALAYEVCDCVCVPQHTSNIRDICIYTCIYQTATSTSLFILSKN